MQAAAAGQIVILIPSFVPLLALAVALVLFCVLMAATRNRKRATPASSSRTAQTVATTSEFQPHGADRRELQPQGVSAEGDSAMEPDVNETTARLRVKKTKVTPEVAAEKTQLCSRKGHEIKPGCNRYVVFATCIECRTHTTWPKNDERRFEEDVEQYDLATRKQLRALWKNLRG